MPDAAPPPDPGNVAPVVAPVVATETFTVHERVAACDGGGGVLGHPRVFLRIPDGARQTFCPYCSRLYVLAEGAGHASGH